LTDGAGVGERGGGRDPQAQPIRQAAGPPDRPTCQRCNFPVQDRAAGCKNPCPNCGTIYPLGDCSD